MFFRRFSRLIPPIIGTRNLVLCVERLSINDAFISKKGIGVSSVSVYRHFHERHDRVPPTTVTSYDDEERDVANMDIDQVSAEYLMSQSMNKQPEQKRGKGVRMKVKFKWKNSLVTADSLNVLENLYKDYPELIEYDEDDLMDYLQKMSRYAIEVDRAAEILLLYPKALRIPEDRLKSCLGVLRSVGLKEGQRKSVLRRIPQLLDIPPKMLSGRYSFLKAYFTDKEVVELIGKTLEVLADSEETLKKKLEYLAKDMSHETKNLVNCKALGFSLNHIKSRHELLVRTGYFKPIPYRRLIKVLEKEYKDRNKPRDKYFKPMLIVCYNDSDFLEFCTNNNIGLNELAAFEELHRAELANQKDMEESEILEETYDSNDNNDNDYYDMPHRLPSLVENATSTAFFSPAESNSCYF